MVNLEMIRFKHGRAAQMLNFNRSTWPTNLKQKHADQHGNINDIHAA